MKSLITVLAGLFVVLSPQSSLAVWVKYPDGRVRWFDGDLMQCQNAGVCYVSPEEQNAIDTIGRINAAKTGNPLYVDLWLLENNKPLEPIEECKHEVIFGNHNTYSKLYSYDIEQNIVVWRNKVCYTRTVK